MDEEDAHGKTQKKWQVIWEEYRTTQNKCEKNPGIEFPTL